MDINMIIFLLILGIILIPVLSNIRKRRIGEKIKSIGGEVISIERRNFFTGIGPFMVVGNGKTVYRIEYQISGQIKEGWVRFGGLFGPNWKL